LIDGRIRLVSAFQSEAEMIEGLLAFHEFREEK
jgi:hypothetical protein